MNRKIKDVYIVHHSHTDIGYTDFQEQVIYNQIYNIRKTIQIIQNGIADQTPQKDLKWNCETWYCVEQFLKTANSTERSAFFDLVRKNRIGLSASYLNGTDLTDCSCLSDKIKEMKDICEQEGISVKTAMIADINGISLGARDALLQNGIEFLYTNIHTHHGMYPLYQNQLPYFWENENGKRLLVWSGEHYNLGNALGIVFTEAASFMEENYFGKNDRSKPLAHLHRNLMDSIQEYEENGYPYDFYITSVSGVFSDNAPVNPQVIETVQSFNNTYSSEVRLHMVTLEELYQLIRNKVQDAPVYRGALNDWWGNGVGSTPHGVKHYKEAVRLSHIANCLEKKSGIHNKELAQAYADNSLLYAEHTWGHSATITNPYDTMVANLDLCKTGYASKAHEAASMRKIEQCRLLGDILCYYDLSGKVKAISTSHEKRLLPVEFYIETCNLPAVKVTDDKTGETLPVQLSSHPRGVLISFLSEFEPLEEKIFSFEKQPAPSRKLFTRTAWIGAERVPDIVNTYDPESCHLPYGIENEFFKISWTIGKGITSFYNKKSDTEMCRPGMETFFTPIYERTPIEKGIYEERRLLGRNIRGLHAKQYQGELIDIRILDHGTIFTKVELIFRLEGTAHSSVIIKMFRDLPKIEFTCRIAKTISEDIESVYLPLSLDLPEANMFIHNGGVPMRPGIDQIPGTNMEYYIADEGCVYQTAKQTILLNTYDTPLLYMGDLRSHPIRLCDNQVENNRRPLYSWIMNNTWETNFKMDLSGFYEFRYGLEMTEHTSANQSLERLTDNDTGTITFICE